MAVKVNHTIHYRRASGEWQPAIVTAVHANNVVDLRIGHYETHTNVPMQTTSIQTGVWSDNPILEASGNIVGRGTTWGALASQTWGDLAGKHWSEL